MSSPTTNPRDLLAPGENLSTRSASSRRRHTNARISAACEACKKRKTKCTGGPPPCQLCKSLGTECVIDLSLDMRRRAALQRTIDESKIYQGTLNGILQCIRSANEQLIGSLIDFVQEGATNSEVAAWVERHPLVLDDVKRPEQVRGYSEGGEENLEDTAQGAEFDPSQGREYSLSNEASTIGSSSAASSSGKSRVDRGPVDDSTSTFDYAALLQRLRKSSVPEGEEILKNYVSLRPSGFSSSAPWQGIEPAQQRVQHDNLSISTQLADGFDDIGKNPVLWDQGWQAVPTATWSSYPRQYDKMVLENYYPQNDGVFPAMRYVGGNIAASSASNPLAFRARANPLGDHVPGQQDLSEGRPGYQSPLLPFVENFNLSISEGMEHPGLTIALKDPGTRMRIPIHLVHPLIVADVSSFSRVYTDYWQGARHLVASGVPLTEVIGYGDEVVVDLFFRKRLPTDKYDCSSWASELCRSFAENNDFEWLANTMLLTYQMRWLLVPTAENYAKLPHMAKPTPAQCMTPHPGSIELIPIPVIRDAVLFKPRDWMTALARSGWSVNWPYSIEEAVDRDAHNGSVKLTRNFINHATNLDHWSVGRTFLETYPEVMGKVRVHD